MEGIERPARRQQEIRRERRRPRRPDPSDEEEKAAPPRAPTPRCSRCGRRARERVDALLYPQAVQPCGDATGARAFVAWTCKRDRSTWRLSDWLESPASAPTLVRFRIEFLSEPDLALSRIEVARA